jgi:hypothetical protein
MSFLKTKIKSGEEFLSQNFAHLTSPAKIIVSFWDRVRSIFFFKIRIRDQKYSLE